MNGHGPVAIVTGASGGIGSATVDRFREQGWQVVAVDRRPVGTPTELTLCADVSDPAEVDRIVAQVQERYHGIDAVVNNAAEQLCKPLLETQVTEWDRIMACNLRSIYLVTTRAYPLLRAVRGCVVNVASVHAAATSPGLAAYVTSKGGVVALTRAMALEFAGDGIRVNAVLPGAIETPMLVAGLRRVRSSTEACSEATLLQALAGRHPLGALGAPDDPAHAIVFLADRERARFITGQTLIVDGGASARLSTESSSQ